VLKEAFDKYAFTSDISTCTADANGFNPINAHEHLQLQREAPVEALQMLERTWPNDPNEQTPLPLDRCAYHLYTALEMEA